MERGVEDCGDGVRLGLNEWWVGWEGRTGDEGSGRKGAW